MPIEYEQPIWTTLNVISYQQSSNNANQWQLKGRWEWTPAANEWGVSIWVDKSICPSVIEAGVHQVLVKRGGKIKKQDGTLHDGSHDWMWRWDIVQWANVEVAPTAQPAPMNYSAQASQQPPVQQPPVQQPPVQQAPPQPAPQPAHFEVNAPPAPVSNADWKAGITNVTENEIRIMRQTALKCASWQIVPFAKDFAQPDMMPQRTIELAEMYLEYFVTGNMFQSIPAPEEIIEEDFGTF